MKPGAKSEGTNHENKSETEKITAAKTEGENPVVAPKLPVNYSFLFSLKMD